MKPVSGYVLAAALLFAAGWLAHGTWDARRYQPAVDSTRVEVAAYDSLQAARLAADSTARERLAKSEARTRAALHAAAAAGQAADSLRGVLLAQVPDTVRGVVLAYDSARQVETDSLRAANAALQEQVGILTIRWRSADSLAILAQARLHDALRRLEAARPRHGWRTDAALLTVGVVGGLLLKP